MLAMEISMALVKARALRFGMFDTIHALLIGDIGYAWKGAEMFELEYDDIRRAIWGSRGKAVDDFGGKGDLRAFNLRQRWS